MKFDKRYLLVAALATGIGFGVAACGGDDDGNDDKTAECTVKSTDCKDGETFNEKDCKCEAKGETTCDKKATDCKTGETFNEKECKCEASGEENTCGNGKLDEGEACDIVDGVESYAEGKNSCEAWAEENKDHDVKLAEGVEQGLPGCSKDCKALSANPKSGKGCVSEDKAACGNGKLDDGEVCDTVDGVVKFADEAAATCSAYAEQAKDSTEYKFGKPGCSSDCKAYKKGTCSVEEANVNGIISCKAELNHDGAKVTASAEVKGADDSKTIKGKVLCGLADEHIKKVINNSAERDFVDAADGKVTAEYEITEAGTYNCVLYVEIESGKGAVCSADGTVVEANAKMSEFTGHEVTK